MAVVSLASCQQAACRLAGVTEDTSLEQTGLPMFRTRYAHKLWASLCMLTSFMRALGLLFLLFLVSEPLSAFGARIPLVPPFVCAHAIQCGAEAIVSSFKMHLRMAAFVQEVFSLPCASPGITKLHFYAWSHTKSITTGQQLLMALLSAALTIVAVVYAGNPAARSAGQFDLF